MANLPEQLKPAERTLMGPGPSDVPRRVLNAMAAPTLRHLDPQYLTIMDETTDLLRRVFRTDNQLTMAVSGTGSAGMEATVVNLVEPGDEVLVAINGVFGMRMTDVAQRCGATVHNIEKEWGQTFSPDEVAEALAAHPNVKLVGIVHAETSTGAHQPLEAISKIVHDADALLLVDAVTSLGGADVRVDDWQIDACYSGTQKCLSCPPGLAPVTFSAAAEARMDARSTKVQSWYLDMSMLRQYWGADRVYHHTAPINMTYALRESLRILLEEGLDAAHARHRLHHGALRAGLEALGLQYIPENSLPMLNAVRTPEGVDEASIRGRLLNDFGFEIGAGLGPFKGQAWRIGIMGHAANRRNVTGVLAALESLLTDAGVAITPGAALAAANEAYKAV
ncbi:MAG: pyridoxal-phosphate-dependent aminotransferase family protein [Planctomycetota bacterium]|jgi:alanine-glyoxylate transaminase/serine-glyoxylate transaminase/serine-pyruvate transaminase